MSEDRVHKAVSADGTEIAGRVLGQGPPLVLVHGAIGDGEFAWEALLPHLTDRFTCYLPSTRGRGLSADSPDHSPPRLEEDVTAFVDSIGDPVRLVGWSGSGPWVVGAAARSGAVVAVAAWEPAVGSMMREEDRARFGGAMEQVGVAATEGRLVDAARAFPPGICNEDEIAALEETDFYEQWACGVPALLQFFQALMAYEGPQSTDPEVLAKIGVPLLLMRGEQTLLANSFADSNKYLAKHVGDPHVRDVPGVGHFAPVLAPERVAKELISFFETARQAA